MKAVHRRRPGCRRGARGASGLLILAVLVVLAGLTAYAFGLVSQASAGLARDHAQARALLAAQAGLDWGRWRVMTPATAQCPATQNLAGLPGALAGFTVTVRCQAGPARVEDGVTRRTYTLSSTACSVPAGGLCPSGSTAAGYVQAVAAAQVTRP
jgi:MSHA biogenesis protein MshP